MPTKSRYLRLLLAGFEQLREEAGISRTALEEHLILGPGWIKRFETGESTPSLDMLLAMLDGINKSLSDLVMRLPSQTEEALPPPKTAEIERYIYAEQSGENLVVHFQYANYDATYNLPDATIGEFEEVIKMLRDGLSKLVNENSQEKKTEAVTQSFLRAIQLWPKANPSDLWWFIIYRAYCDPFNHPARYARLNFDQSWKRTSGWALEQILVRHYNPFLKKKGIELVIAPTKVKEQHLRTLKVGERLEADKMDVLLFGTRGGEEILFGVVHVKASFAERRTDDVPMSKALVAAGYCSPLWTMDCKSGTKENPFNKGELGAPFDKKDKRDKRSAKRKDIEEDAYFSACFSYNTNTKPTPPNQKTKARIYICDFQNPDDEFARFIISAWRKFLHA